MKIFFSSVLSLVLISNITAQKVDLRLHLNKGSSYYYTITGLAKIHEIVEGNDVDMIMGINCKTGFTVNDAGKKDYALTVMYNSFGMDLTMQDRKISFRSGGTDRFSRILKDISKIPFSVQMTDKGELINISNFDSAITALINNIKEIKPEQKAAITEQMLYAYGAESFKGNFNMLTNLFPRTKVKTGDQWVITTKLETGMAATLATTYTLTGIKDDHYGIHAEAELTTADKAAYKEVAGRTAKYNLTGKMISELEIDKSSGWIISAKIHQTMNGTADLINKEDPTDILSIPVTFTNEVTVTGQ